MMGEEELLLDCLQRLNASALDYMLTGLFLRGKADSACGLLNRGVRASE
jgi:hypothetical protein